MSKPELSTALRASADLVDALNGLPFEVGMFPTYDGLYVYVRDTDAELAKRRFAEVVRAALPFASAPMEKAYAKGDIKVTLPLGGGYKVQLVADGVCKATVVGKRTTTERRVVTPAVYEEVEVEVDHVEYDCAPSVLSASLPDGADELPVLPR